MPRHLSRTLSLALVLTVGCAPLLAAPGRTAHAATPPAPADAAQQLWSGLVALWNAAGCIIDPNGISRCAASGGNSSAPAPAGCTGDPDGIRCASATSSAPLPEGCSGDPDGIRCAAARGSFTLQPPPEGCMGDPNGLCVSQH
jgi:hypothetical protein